MSLVGAHRVLGMIAATNRAVVVSAAIMLAAVALSLLTIKFVPSPYIWISALWATIAFTAAARVTGLYQAIALVCASVTSALGVGELVAAFLAQPDAKVTVTFDGVDGKVVPQWYNEPDEELGWRNVSGLTALVTKSVRGSTIYSVRYTFDRAGRRIVPRARDHGAQGCVLFFADSFIFGEGVNDEESLPYRVGARTGGRFRIFNFGVGGYGAHQMLAQLDGPVSALDCSPSHVIYLALPHHVARVANKALTGGPRYELDENGELHRKPPVRVAHAGLLDRLLTRSNSYRLLQEKYLGYVSVPTDADLERYFLVVSLARERVLQRLSGVEFHTLAWNLHPWFAESYEHFRTGLAAAGWQVHDVDHILPGYQKDQLRYSLSPYDLHPNALAYDLIAAYIGEKILQRTPPASR